MAFDKKRFEEVISEFTMDTEELQRTAEAFQREIRIGLEDAGKSSLQMLKSYAGLPTGKETGEYLALDFGGTNVRVLRIRLEGGGKFEIAGKAARPLRVEGEYDYICAEAKAEEMFDFLAGLIEEAVEGDREKKYFLGHTFSFPSEQTDLYNARLIAWTKEFATQGVEGKVVNDLLKEALERKGLSNVEPVAVINDTVAVLLSASYKQDDVYIGSIYATGHNTCYLEPHADAEGRAMILNLEAGGFDKVSRNRFDEKVDALSDRPGTQRLEKMVSGRYMGELLGIALGSLYEMDEMDYGFTSIDMSEMLQKEGSIEGIVSKKLGKVPDMEECRDIQCLARVIAERSARLVAATFVGTMRQLSGKEPIKKQHIAVDGSVYEKMPGAKEYMASAFLELLGEDAGKVDTVLDCGGSGLGAAIAAVVSKQ